MTKAATWTMQGGHTIKIKDMTDSHLINTIRMLERNAPKVIANNISDAHSILGFLQGEMAIYCAEGEVDRWENMTVDEFLEFHTSYTTLIWHAKRRGLDYRNPDGIRNKIKESRKRRQRC
jgi:hypothetical protein